MDYDSPYPVERVDFWLCSLSWLVVLLQPLWVDDRGKHCVCGDTREYIPDHAEPEKEQGCMR